MADTDKEYTPEPAGDEESQTPDPASSNSPDNSTTPVEPSSEEKSPTFSDPGFDVNEVNRKLTAMCEEIGLLHKAISQLMTSAPSAPYTGNATDSTRPSDEHGDKVKTIDELDL